MTDGTAPRPAPYPADTRAKGWRFELDYEAIDQSDTWPIAAEIPMAQHSLLMMWLVAWSKQVPCGSFPDDENVIRAACRIPPAVWSKVREVAMRGWWKAADGRLYHPTLTKRVLEMLARRRSDSGRQAARRARLQEESAEATDGVTLASRVTPDGVHSESSTDHRPPTTESNTPPVPRKGGRKGASGDDDGFARFWQAYPRKVARQKAWQAFQKLAPDAGALDLMLAAVERQRATEQWQKDDGQYIPHPASWLNGRRWEDQAATTSSMVRGMRSAAHNHAAAARFLAAGRSSEIVELEASHDRG